MRASALLRTGGAAIAVWSLLWLGSCSTTERNTAPRGESAFIQRVRGVFARVSPTLAKNYKSFNGPAGPVSGFGAGDAYPQIWLRDSAWIVDAAAASYPKETLTSWLDLHLASAAPNGRLRDWVARGSAKAFLEWAPKAQSKGDLAFDTNTNESDQEPSAALALCRIEKILGAAGSVDDVGHAGRASRAIAAMDALARDRTDLGSGLIWSGLTADWGDVSPVHPDQRAIYLDAKTPRTLSLYSNVMAFAALDCLGGLAGPGERRESLAARAVKFRERIRSAFWMKDRGYFRIRRTLDAVPDGFGHDDDTRFALGGNALAALFGVADDAQSASIFETAERLRVAHKSRTISAVLVPPYAKGVFQHPVMREPFEYQNGGEWDWFGAALVEAEFERGYSERALRHLDQIVTRTLLEGPGLSEWYARDGSAKGSPAYSATAAAIYNAVVKGLLGISRSPAGYRIVIRAGETLRPFEIPQRAASTRLVVSQDVTPSSIDVLVQGDAPIEQVCSVPPRGRAAADLSAHDSPQPQRVQRLGDDTIMCADVSSSPMPVRVRFAIR